jgi:N6-adenosine-specific RNA methylase IME4
MSAVVSVKEPHVSLVTALENIGLPSAWIRGGSLELPAPESIDEWRNNGRLLGRGERIARCLMWAIGDWWNSGEAYGERVSIVTASGWDGPTYGTCRTAGSISARFPICQRVNTLTFGHHYAVANLPPDERQKLLSWCSNGEEPRPIPELRARAKQIARNIREVELGDKIDQTVIELGVQQYGVIYADPPWRFEPRSRVTGMDRAADNHYPTMTLEQIQAVEVPAADDCVLFLWATAAMLIEGINTVAAWEFDYKSAYAWIKPGAGHGYWSREDQLELLLIGTRGNIPAPAMGTQPKQAQTYPRSRHSAKPLEFAAQIAAMFPSLPKLEMFARGPALPGWDAWGAEAEYPVSER